MVAVGLLLTAVPSTHKLTFLLFFNQEKIDHWFLLFLSHDV